MGEIEAAAPESVGATVMRRARAIEPAAAALLEAAAVLGPDAELRHAAGLTGFERNRVATLADALAAIGVLAGGERLTFAQPAVAAAVHRSLPAAERAEAHLWAARALSDDDAPAEPVADHLLRAAKGGGAWVTSTLQTAAARALATGAAGRAVELLERALREPPPRDQRAHVLLDLGRAQAIAGQPEALGAARRGDRPPPGGGGACGHGPGDRTHPDVARAPRGGRRGVRTGGALRGRGRARRGRPAGRGPRNRRAARARGGRAPAPCERRSTATRPAAGPLLAQLALDAALRGDSHETVRVLASRALARGALLDDDTAEGIVYYLATAALTVAEDLQMAEAALAAAVNDARSRGSALALATASHFQSFAIMRRGRVHAAAAAARAALEGERHGWRLALPSAHVVLAAALGESGDLAGAEAQVELAGADAEADAASRVRPSRGPCAASPRAWPAAGGARGLHRLRRAARGRRGAQSRGPVLALRRGSGAGRAGRSGRGSSPGGGGAGPGGDVRRSRRDREGPAYARLARGGQAGHRPARGRGRVSRELADRAGAREGARGPRLDAAPDAPVARRARSVASRARPRSALRGRGAGEAGDARGDRSGRPAAALGPSRLRGTHTARAPDGRARRRGEVEPRDRGRAVRDREDGRVAPQAQLREARDRFAPGARGSAGAPARRPAIRPTATFELSPDGQDSDGDCGIARKLLKAWSVAVDIHPGAQAGACIMQ